MGVIDQAGSPGWVLDAVGRAAGLFHAVYCVCICMCAHMCIYVCVNIS